MNTKIDEATVHIALAAYRLGAKDASATPPSGFLTKCIRLIEADTEVARKSIISEVTA